MITAMSKNIMRALALASVIALTSGLAESQPTNEQGEVIKKTPPIPTVTFISPEQNKGAKPPQIRIYSVEEVELNAPIRVMTPEEFERVLTLESIKHNGFQNEEEIAQFLDAYKPQDAKGRPLLSLTFDDETGRVLGASNAIIVVNSAYENDAGKIALVVSGKDESGNPVKIVDDTLWVGGTDGNQEPVVIDSFENAQAPMIVEVLVDTSGSMNNHIGSVVDAAKNLLDGLPDHMLCGVISFGKKIIDFAEKGYPSCAADNFKLDAIKSGGGTPLFGALKAAYTKLNNPALENHQKSVVVLTDGGPSDEKIKDAVTALQNGTNTIFFWLGNKNNDAEQVVKPLATNFVATDQDAVTKLSDYFDKYREAIAAQAVIVLSKPKQSTLASSPTGPSGGGGE